MAQAIGDYRRVQPGTVLGLRLVVCSTEWPAIGRFGDSAPISQHLTQPPRTRWLWKNNVIFSLPWRRMYET